MAKQKTLFKGPLAKLEDLGEKFVIAKDKVAKAQDEKNDIEEKMLTAMDEKGIKSFRHQNQTFKIKYQAARRKISAEA